MPVPSTFATTIANPLGARQEFTPAAPADNIVTAVRRFSESLLSNPVSKEVQQEVKALAAHMEIFANRRRQAVNQPKSPSAAETRIALRNLRRFLERETRPERGRKKKPSSSCTSDTLESSSSHIELSSATGLHSPSAVCDSKGDTKSRKLRLKYSKEPPAELLRLRRCIHTGISDSIIPEQSDVPLQVTLRRQHMQSRPSPQGLPAAPLQPPSPTLPPPPLLSVDPARTASIIQLTCSEPLPLLLLAADLETGAEILNESSRPDVDARVHLLTEWAPPICSPEAAVMAVKSAAAAIVSAPLCQLLLHCLSPSRVERPPLVASNLPLPANWCSLDVAIESTLEEAATVTTETNYELGVQKITPVCSPTAAGPRRGLEFGISTTMVTEQGNFSCASVISHVATIGSAPIPKSSQHPNNPPPAANNQTTAGQSIDSNLSNDTTVSNQPLVGPHPAACAQVTTSSRGPSTRMVSTCSFPSDSKEGDEQPVVKTIKGTEESVDLRTSSALIRQVELAASQGHGSIEAAQIRLLPGVCESSCAHELLASSAGFVTVSAADSGGPAFQVVDLSQLVRKAAPLPRSRSLTVDLEVSGRPPGDLEDTRTPGRRSNSTLEVVDQSETAAEAPGPTADQPTCKQQDQAVGTSWSSCEMGRSSGFTKLLITLDKAAKRRREQARNKKRQWAQKQQQPKSAAWVGPAKQPEVAAAAIAVTMRTDDKKSECLLLQQPQLAKTAGSTAAAVARRQEEALKMAAQSLAELAKSLQVCVERVQQTAEAISRSL